MNQTKKGLSYFRLKLEVFLKDYHPDMLTDTAFIPRADALKTAF